MPSFKISSLPSCWAPSLPSQRRPPWYACILLMQDRTPFPLQEEIQCVQHLSVSSGASSHARPFLWYSLNHGLWQLLFQNQQGVLRICFLAAHHFSHRVTTWVSSWLAPVLIWDYPSLQSRCVFIQVFFRTPDKCPRVRDINFNHKGRLRSSRASFISPSLNTSYVILFILLLMQEKKVTIIPSMDIR